MIAVYYLKDVNVMIFVKILMKKKIKVFVLVYVKEENVILKYVKIVNIVIIQKRLMEFLKKQESVKV
jgi:hypothetical protein